MQITFLGAAGEVTGSCFRVDGERFSFLVDCGMFQGGRDSPMRNRRAAAERWKGVDFVLLTHAHVDHSGLLPALVREGFNRPVYATPATKDLLEIILPDSGHLQETEAERAARPKARRNRSNTEPLYTVDDALRTIDFVQPVAYGEIAHPNPRVQFRFRDAGHILGSAIIEVWVEERGQRTKLVFSGDLGQPGRPIIRDPESIGEADLLFVESTYGNRRHKNLQETLDELVDAVNETRVRGGNVIIPAFAVGRTQEIIYHLHDLTRQGRLRDLDIYVDSPMAIAATYATGAHLALFDEEARHLAAWQSAGKGVPRLHFVETADGSRALNDIKGGAIIISASGMCDAGRIKHHLRHNLPRAECSVVIVGFQAQGSLGRRLVDGAQRVRIFGEELPVRARIHTLNGLSAHGDIDALFGWLGGFERAPARTFVVHGEAATAEGFASAIRERLGWETTAPQQGDVITP